MRSDLLMVLGTLVAGSAWLALEHGREALVAMETFRVREIEVRGARFVERDEVVSLLGLDETSSVWGDRELWSERVERHPLIREAEVARRFPDGLVVEVEERRPIALAPAPALEPVDVEGQRLPIDPAVHRLDLPVIEADVAVAPRARFFPREVRRLAAELGRLTAADTAFLQRVSDLSWEEGGALRVGWTEPPVDFLLPAGTPVGRLRDGLQALAHALGRDPGSPPAEIDLRFADQVVVRRTNHR